MLKTSLSIALRYFSVISLMISLMLGLNLPMQTALAEPNLNQVEYQTLNPTLDINLEDGERIFSTVCAGCHVNGSNIIRRGKNLQLKTLQRQQLDSIAAITEIVTNGRGIMSAYGNKLTPEEINAVANYVLDRAQHNWQS